MFISILVIHESSKSRIWKVWIKTTQACPQVLYFLSSGYNYNRSVTRTLGIYVGTSFTHQIRINILPVIKKCIKTIIHCKDFPAMIFESQPNAPEFLSAQWSHCMTMCPSVYICHKENTCLGWEEMIDRRQTETGDCHPQFRLFD